MPRWRSAFDEDVERAAKTALERWPLLGLPGELPSELPLPRHFEQAAALVRLEDIRGKLVAGADAATYVDRIHAYVDAGFDHVFLHQVGVDQETFFGFAERELLPAVREEFSAATA